MRRRGTLKSFMRQLEKPRPGLTLFLALTIAVAAVAAVWITYTQRQDNGAEKARRLDVELFRGSVLVGSGAQRLDGWHLVASNSPPGRAVRVSGAGIFLPDGPPYPSSSPAWIVPTKGDWKFPCHVEEDDSRIITLTAPTLKALCEGLAAGGRTGSVNLVGFYVEAGTQKRYTSEPVQFNIDEALALAKEGGS